jgi:hypothetical protein
MGGINFAGSTSSANAPQIEADIYDARFDGVKTKVLEQSQYDPNVFEWGFTLLDRKGAVLYDDGEPITVSGLTSQSVNVKSKTTPRAVTWLKALMTAQEFALFVVGENVAASALEGRKVQLVIEIADSGWPKVKDVLPARKKKAPVAVVEDDDDE